MSLIQKVAVGVACLVAVVAIVIWDQSNLRKGETAAPVAAPALPQTALAPLAAPTPAPAKPEEPIVCPKDCVAEKPEGAAPAAAPVPVMKEPDRLYTVSQGDSLYGISTKVYGTPRFYERIYQANKDRIKNPNTLQIGINLIMPEIAVTPAPQ